MRPLQFMKSAQAYLEIGQTTLKVLVDGRGLDLPLERRPSGPLTDACKQGVIAALREFLRSAPGAKSIRACCAIGARGVSLRRLAVPASARDNFHQVLALQIEREFPLPPSELAWGCLPVPSSSDHSGAPGPAPLSPANGTSIDAGARDVLIVAVRKSVLSEYKDLLVQCGLNPVFTLAAWTASSLCPPGRDDFAVLNIGPAESEFITFEQGVPSAIRSLPGGSRSASSADPTPASAPGPDTRAGKTGGELEALAAGVVGLWSGRRLYVTGTESDLGSITRDLARQLHPGTECHPLPVPTGPGRSPALAGLESLCASNGRLPALILQTAESAAAGHGQERTRIWPWAALAAVLVLGLFSLRYAEVVLKKPGLIRRMEDFKAAQSRQPSIDRELEFLQHLDTNQLPYLKVLAVLGDAAARGTRIDTLSMNRLGELTFRGTMPNSKVATECRAQLIESGWFDAVVLEEQTPVPNQQKVTVKFSARWRSAPSRPPQSNAQPDTPSSAQPAIHPATPPGSQPSAMPIATSPGPSAVRSIPNLNPVPDAPPPPPSDQAAPVEIIEHE